MCPNSQFRADLVTLTKEILHGKLDFLCSGIEKKNRERPVAWNGLRNQGSYCLDIFNKT